MSVVVFWVLCSFSIVCGQKKLAPNTYLIRFTDKNQNTFHLSQPAQFLSARALQRRSNQSISISENDLPVSHLYIDSVQKTGAMVLNISKWLNAVSVKITDTIIFNKLSNISFIKHSQIQKSSITKRYISNKFETSSSVTETPGDYGASYNQIALHNGDFLHNLGFRGNGMLIAVLDAGFNNARNMSALDSLWIDNRITLTRDFVYPGGDVFVQDQHGANVLSILASTSHGNLIGSAPKASYVLLRSEDATLEPSGIQREYPIEEFNWACAAELADSLGVDIISSSLGYTTFNDPTLNHTYQDMNGYTSLASIAAEVASSKGIIVVVSAGNEGNNYWHYISAPADADRILTVGAIDSEGFVTLFSSRGPTSDGRLKPDVVAKGYHTTMQNPDNSFVTGNGTSFSSPIISGLTACLWQSCPLKTNLEVMNAIRKLASQASSPDNTLGYGIPDFRKAYYALNVNKFNHYGTLVCYPAPFSSSFTVEFEPIPENTALIQIYSLTGKLLISKMVEVEPNLPNFVEITDMAQYSRGVYILQVNSSSKKMRTRILKM